MFRSSNPALRRMGTYQQGEVLESASYKGIAFKSLYFIALTIGAGLVTFFTTIDLVETNETLLIALMIAGPMVAFICSLVAIFSPRMTPYFGSVYALMQGLFLGAISAFFNYFYEGIVLAALGATISVFLIMAVLYATGAIRVGAFFRKFMIAALLSMLLFTLVVMIISFIEPSVGETFYGNGPVAIIVCVIMIILAALMLLLDFDRMTQIVQNGMDKKYEWTGAFGLLLTLVWLFIEFLRLFAIIASRRR
ncbi:MAG: Bax inhibitor-1/YccA family protein [Firmicutes bacterium]|nr:Bax inhibitor-1/YccA family protein [Bacillota bacterium]